MTNSAVLEQADQSSTVSSSIGFTIERAALLKALAHVQSVVEKRNTIAILANVKLEVFDNTLSLTATDMDIAVTETIDATTSQEGALTVPAHTLYDIVRKLPDGSELEIKGDASGNGKVQINSGSCKFSLSCLPVNEFPVMDKGNMQHNFVLSSPELFALIDKTKFAISTEETRYYLNGIYLHVRKVEGEAAVLCAVATDGHRLAKVESELPAGAADMPGVIIPRKTIMELRKFLEEAESDIEISVSETKACFAFSNAVLLTKLIDGTFPDYDRVIPYDNDKILQINASAFARAVDRVSTVSSDKTRAIKLETQKNCVILSAVSEENGTAKEEIEASYDDDSIEIGFNSKYILDMLSGFEGDEVKLTISDNAAPALVRDGDDEAALYVIMPMRI